MPDRTIIPRQNEDDLFYAWVALRRKEPHDWPNGHEPRKSVNAGTAKLTAARLQVLRLAAREGGVQRGTELARSIGIPPQSLNSQTACLLTAGLVESRRVPGERARRLFITDKGRQVIGQ